jgi:hypothetical protein
MWRRRCRLGCRRYFAPAIRATGSRSGGKSGIFLLYLRRQIPQPANGSTINKPAITANPEYNFRLLGWFIIPIAHTKTA